MAKSTDNNSQKPDSSITLRQTERNSEIADKVNALLVGWEALGAPGELLTRRQARKFLQKRPNTKIRVWLMENGK